MSDIETALFPASASTHDLEEGARLTPRFDANGLVTCVATDAATGEILMLAHMNAEALALTIATGEAHYYSRSRKKLWKKGESSGHTQKVVDMLVDCDQDAVVIKVEMGGTGAACHTGRRSCFYRRVPLGHHAAGETPLAFTGDTPRFDPKTVYGDDHGHSH
ncbi:phosphoribosyl-AMP cyclohydrolase [Aquabacter sp. L1I39]|uniref:phosphoribosyl-AMP cyclohydrolase n=1 Tax=Aquabacter sp. L1I39 TaxID=2820278 RepID=UPI001ADB7406|nr:phosphoribosyl-AMP cyclohydrolase [Aquabacter sp. L1I39]QTL05556.1 phosphoribosyl-AMP cyclohydrolase [Aquabacter sp. L1I39]